MVDQASFNEWTRDALDHYHNAARLQSNPLLDVLVEAAPAGHAPSGIAGRVPLLRNFLRQAIESLGPDQETPPGAPERAGYRVLVLRCLEGRTQVAICDKLGISRATFYRLYQESVGAVARVLWEHYQRGRGTEAPAAATPARSLAEEEALRIARASQPEAVPLGRLIEGIRTLLLPLAAQHKTRMIFPEAVPAITVYADPAILRQIIVSTLVEALALCADKSLTLEVEAQGEWLVLRVRNMADCGAVAQRMAPGQGLALGRALVELNGGRYEVYSDERGRTVLSIALPLRAPQTILIIDDDADTARLYRRYLQPHGYQVLDTPSGDQAWAWIQDHPPALVLLDVLMPHEDGWAILQRIKAAPETASIPVVICSVLCQPELAFSLGAALVLNKPLSEEALLRAVRALLGPPDSADVRYPTGPAGSEHSAQA